MSTTILLKKEGRLPEQLESSKISQNTPEEGSSEYETANVPLPINRFHLNNTHIVNITRG